MSDWRLDESPGAETEAIREIDVIPGHPAILSRIERFQGEVEHHPHDWQARVGLAQALAQNGMFEEALRQLRFCLDLVSDARTLAGILFNTGICYESQEAWPEAIAAYEQCAFLLPHLAWVHHRIGVCLHRMGELARAIDELRLAASLDDAAPELCQSLAQACLEAGLVAEAQRACRRCLELDPYYMEARQTLRELRARIH